jgi:thiosulfate/3-mercaptopyruvate sulfurtransferase
MSLCLSLGLTANAMAAPHPELRISVDQLTSLIPQANVVLIDARPATEYQQGHLPGARNLPFKSTFQDFTKSGLVLASERAKLLFQSIGLKNDDLVVVYDGSNMVQAARVFWTLEMNGHTKVRLLDGGLQAWQASGQQLTQDTPHIEVSNYKTQVNKKAVKTWVDVQEAVDNPKSYILIDARDGEHFAGLKTEAYRSGHIPTARSVPVNKNLTADGHLRSMDELRALYGVIPKGTQVVVYCSKGLASSLEYLVLREQGLDVGNYESSWMEWGNKLNLPIVNPTGTTDAQ